MVSAGLGRLSEDSMCMVSLLLSAFGHFFRQRFQPSVGPICCWLELDRLCPNAAGDLCPFACEVEVELELAGRLLNPVEAGP